MYIKILVVSDQLFLFKYVISPIKAELCKDFTKVMWMVNRQLPFDITTVDIPYLAMLYINNNIIMHSVLGS